VRTVFAYRGTARRLVHRLKFDARSDGLEVLAPALAAAVAELPVDAVVPVPRHWRRIRSQGTDPVHALAHALARRTGLPVFTRVLVRTRAVPPQTGLDLAQRTRNVRGSFRARPGALRGLRVLLLDDVATTGATLAEAERALAEALPWRSLPLALCGTPAL
jgi:ComF family protein